MFKNNKKVDPNLVETVVGPGVVIEGVIKTQTSVRIDGTVKGEIESEGNIIVGEKGLVEANVKASGLEIAGIVNGNVVATERIAIKQKGKLMGETRTKSFIIDEGGTFLGRSNMEVEGLTKEEPQAPTEEKKEAKVEEQKDEKKKEKEKVKA